MKSDSWVHLSPSDARGIYSKMYKQTHNRRMWRLILYASLIGLRHAQTWFLGASVSVYLEEISIWFRSLHQGILFSSVGRQLGAWREQNGGGRRILFLSWDVQLFLPLKAGVLGSQASRLRDFSGTYTRGPCQAFGLRLNYIHSGFPGSPACA